MTTTGEDGAPARPAVLPHATHEHLAGDGGGESTLTSGREAVAADGTDPGDDDPVENAPGLVATFQSVWRHRPWRWLAASTVVSLFGDVMYAVAIAVFFLDGTNGAAWLAASFLARLLPYVVLGPVGGVIADRFDRRTLMVGLSVVRGGLFVAMAAIVLADGPRLAVVALLTLNAAGGAVFEPARGAAIPQLVPERDLAAANATEQGLSQLSWFIGPAVGALLLTVVDPGVVLAIDAGTFFLTAFMLAHVGALVPAARDASGEEPATVLRGMVDDIRSGAQLAFRERGLRGLLVINAVATMAFGAGQILYVLVAADRLDLGAAGVGYLLTAMGVGGIIATPLSARASNSPQIGRWLVGTGFLVSVPMILVSFTHARSIVLAMTALEGAAAVIFDVVVLTLLQRSVAETATGRVFSLSDALGTLGQTIGSLGAPVLVSAVSLTFALQVSGGIALASVLLVTPAVLALAARTESERKRLKAAVRRLAAVDDLAAFDPIELERLARASHTRAVCAGEVVITAGEAPDDLYVVRSGRFHVVAAGEATAVTLPDLVPGRLFGEIGLLRGIPRTATITAITDGEVIVIDGTVFVAVATPSAAAEPLLRGVRARLSRTHPQLAESIVPGGAA